MSDSPELGAYVLLGALATNSRSPDAFGEACLSAAIQLGARLKNAEFPKWDEVDLMGAR